MSNWFRFPWSKARNVVRVVRMQGIIKTGKANSVNLRLLEKDIDKAFDCKKVKPKAVCLEINSMGGFPVQSSLIYERIRYLSVKKNVPVLAFAEDYAVSGGYWLSLAADEIFVSPTSMVGSIGVVAAMFGFQDAITKLGIERRVYASGENKLRLDVFQPSKESDIKWLNQVLCNVQKEFEKIVKERRPGLQVDHPTLFSGDAFTGHEAVKIGLADGVYGDPREIICEKFGKDVRIQRPPQGFWDRFGSKYTEVSAAQQLETMNGFMESLQEIAVEARLQL